MWPLSSVNKKYAKFSRGNLITKIRKRDKEEKTAKIKRAKKIDNTAENFQETFKENKQCVLVYAFL